MRPLLTSLVCILLLSPWLPASGLAAGPDTVSVAIVLDNSGSMGETDPDRMRLIAARLMVDLLDKGDRVAIISFSNGARLVAPLTEIRGAAERANLKKPLHGTTPAGDTDYRSALQLATAQLGNAPAGQRAVLFLTDGEMHPAGWDQLTATNKDAEVRAVQTIADGFGGQGWKLFPLSFKRFIPQGSALLSDLALRGRGFYRQIEDVSGLNSAFEAIYSSLRGAVFQGMAEICEDTPKTVLPSMKRLLITLVAKTPGRLADLIPPQDFGGRIEVRDDDEGYYRVLVVDEPTPGEWLLRPQPGQCVLLGSIESHNVRVTLLSPPEQAPVGEPLQVQVKVDEQVKSGGSDAWQPLKDAEVSVDLLGPGSAKSVKLELSPSADGVNHGIYQGLLDAAQVVSGMYRLDTVVRKQGQFLFGVPPVPKYIEVGAFPKLDVSVTPDEGTGGAARAGGQPAVDQAVMDKVVQARAVLSGDADVANTKINWRTTGPSGEEVLGEASDDGQTFEFKLGGDGLYMISATLEGTLQGARGPTRFRTSREVPVVLMREPPKLSWLLGEHAVVEEDTPVAAIPLRATFLSRGEQVRVDKAVITATVAGPQGRQEEIRLAPDGGAFGQIWKVERSGTYTLTVKGDAVYMGKQLLGQTDIAYWQVQLPAFVSLRVSAREWGTWNDAPKLFTLQAASNSGEATVVELSLSEPGLEVSPASITVQPGEAQRFELTVQRAGKIPPGKRSVMLRAESVEATIDPGELPLATLDVPSELVRTLIYGGGVILLLVINMLVIRKLLFR